MMKQKQKWGIILLIILSLAALFTGGIIYITNVQNALWTNAVTNILEVTSQGCHALNTYIEKDSETLRMLSSDLSQINADNEESIQNKIHLFNIDKTTYICVNLNTGIAYTDVLGKGYTLQADQINTFRTLYGHGVREPFLDEYTGVWTIGSYERFSFADGTEGYVQRTQPISKVSDRFSLSFYDNTGFSYVVNRDGNILIHSQHRNSNRTFRNLFDIIDLQGNDEKEISSFQQALQKGEKGVARFQYKKEDYVFCFVPMEEATDWYVVSIIPNRVIMEQANNIVQQSQILFILIFTSILIVVTFFLFYRYSTHRILSAKEEARKAAESANIAKSRFLSNMSHDIRTPMNAIIGMTKLAQDHVHEPERVQKYLKNINTSGRLLVGLINDILDLSKIESGKMTLNNITASLEELLTGLVKIIQPIIDEKNQEFAIRIHEIKHEALYFDALRLNQILINLLSNAAKFTPDRGKISIDVTESPSQRENYVHYTFCVADTGIGIKKEFLNQIFDSFTREQDSRVNKIEGSGLGMAITKMIVDLMQGIITVESQPGKGTTFTVELDFMLPPETYTKDLSLPPFHILFADDDMSTCQSIKTYSSEMGIITDITESGQTAIKMAVEQDYDLILLDWKMSDINGAETACAIRKQINKPPSFSFLHMTGKR